MIAAPELRPVVVSPAEADARARLLGALLDTDRLPPAAQRVWRAAAQHLTTHEHRPLKVLVLVGATGLHRVTVVRALAQLVAQGYLVRGPRLARQPVCYRLPIAPACPIAAALASAAVDERVAPTSTAAERRHTRRAHPDRRRTRVL